MCCPSVVTLSYPKVVSASGARAGTLIGSLHDVATQLPLIGSCEGEYFLFGCSPPKAMALYYTRCLQDLPKVSVNDVLRLIRALSSAPRCKKEKGFKFYVSNYIDNYEGKH
ncbi:hypothetical protein ATANTOWER_030483 [Ataeniobius toweri]|uniref:Uncharacterized protein n=1 Tax=Ataeniobius toweri TaxID=208326 RepID=A0ABU7BI77_9TELE|nr:hypothetical protein [Ataeniobius toweri]